MAEVAFVRSQCNKFTLISPIFIFSSRKFPCAAHTKGVGVMPIFLRVEDLHTLFRVLHGDQPLLPHSLFTYVFSH